MMGSIGWTVGRRRVLAPLVLAAGAVLIACGHESPSTPTVHGLVADFRADPLQPDLKASIFPDTFQFTNTSTGATGPVKCVWDFGETVDNTSAICAPTHRFSNYGNAGTFQVRLTVSAADGTTASVTRPVTLLVPLVVSYGGGSGVLAPHGIAAIYVTSGMFNPGPGQLRVNFACTPFRGQTTYVEFRLYDNHQDALSCVSSSGCSPNVLRQDTTSANPKSFTWPVQTRTMTGPSNPSDPGAGPFLTVFNSTDVFCEQSGDIAYIPVPP